MKILRLNLCVVAMLSLALISCGDATDKQNSDGTTNMETNDDATHGQPGEGHNFHDTATGGTPPINDGSDTDHSVDTVKKH
jgi:hypothetical protein